MVKTYRVRICYVVEVEAEDKDEATAIAISTFQEEIIDTPQPYDVEDILEVKVEEVGE